MEYDFTLNVVGMTDLDEFPLQSFFEAGCDDGTVGVRRGRVHIQFSRDAVSLNEAVGSAIVALKSIGIDAFLASVESPEKVADVA